MKALLIGGGVCGPATAMALQRTGIDAIVYEAHEAENDRGSYLTVATNGLDALCAIDAHVPVLAAGFPTRRTVLISGTGKRLGTVAIGSNRDQRLAGRCGPRGVERVTSPDLILDRSRTALALPLNAATCPDCAPRTAPE
jgi:2-polyprenyl-6-methoxyphenol hydroxylase-like FAD-dependent oxidoreductase